MENCLVRNFYKNVLEMASNGSETTEISYLLSPAFVATSITTFAVLFAIYLIYYLSRISWKILSTTYRAFFVPLNKIIPLGSIGYMNHESYHLSQQQLVNLVRRRRKFGRDLPPIYPNGWFRVLDSMFLKKCEVKQVTAFGENMVAFRGETGKVSVLDAYCSHMGANMAVGGRVLGECIECPFHAWTFDGKGKCVRVPYAEKVPDFGSIKSWPCREVNGNIYIWYHCDNIEPQWEIPAIPEIETGQYSYGGRIEHHTNTHIRDIPENGYDEAHFQHLHIPSPLCGSNLATQFDSKFNICDQIMKTDYTGTFDSEERHIARFVLDSKFHVLRKWTAGHIKFNIWQIGPGIVYLYLTSCIGKIIVVQNTTPVEPMDQVLTHSIYTARHIPKFVAKLALMGVGIQVDRDLMVWNNRTFLAHPLLLKEEKIQKKFRRWFQQFYTENSPRLGDVKKDDLDW